MHILLGMWQEKLQKLQRKSVAVETVKACTGEAEESFQVSIKIQVLLYS